MVKKLEENLSMEIHFLHIMDMPDTVTLNVAGQIETCGDIDAGFVNSQKEIAERKLENLKKLYGDKIQTHLALGKITDNIISFSQKNGFDLIVMGTKGAWGVKEKLSGSETQMVARRSEIPLLSMMCDRSQLTIKNILMVHDFRNPENENMELLKKLITAFSTVIHFLQVVKDESENLWLLSQMDEFARLNGITNFKKHLLNDKDIENGVIHFNQMHEMDIICLGTHGRKGIERIIHPSATEKLINHLFKPIISFHLTHS